jgi:hypothetical protein
MKMLARTLIIASSALMLVLGGIHLLYTFWGGKLAPLDPAVQAAMGSTPLRLTAETTVWKAWVGFNASHSMCAIFFGLVFGFLAAGHPDLLLRSWFLQGLGLAVLLAFVVLARLYWFSIPFFGVSIALACYLAGILVARLAPASTA